jgi:8-oxo-dGTP pyrophosphatase MutT (NUDIX family)
MGAARRVFAAGAAGTGTQRVQVAAGEAGAAGAAGAAVLIVLVPCDERDSDSAVSVVLIRRAAHLRANPGEVAFPGGRIELGEDPLAAALREAEEEVALTTDAVEVLGELSSLARPRRSAPILPFVGAARGRPALEPNPDEVDCVLVVPLAELVTPGRYWQERWDRAGDPAWTMHFFDLGEDVIWGATAEMLHALFLCLLGRRVSPPVPS